MDKFWFLDNKVIIALISVFIGWFLAQGTALIKSILEFFAQKYALFCELGDIKEKLAEVAQSLERSLQIYALDGFDDCIPNKIPQHIYEKYYPEICMGLTRTQRASYQRIHGCIESINLNLSKLREIYPLTEEQREKISIEDWGGLLKGLYLSTREAYWLTSYHINNPFHPIIGDSQTDEYKAISESMKESKVHIDKLIDGARKNLSRDDFDD